jgi:F-type H+-transporting ATPase subunit a
MTAGHTALAVFFSMAIWIGASIGWLPFIFTVLLWGLEIFIAFIQAYIFTTLATVYVGNAVHLH